MKSNRCSRLGTTFVGLVLALWLFVPSSAFAQGFELQQFSPMPSQTDNLFDTSSADVPDHMGWSAHLLFNFGSNPLVWRDDDGEHLQSIVAQQATTHLLLSLGLFEIFELGVDVPVVVLQNGEGAPGLPVTPEQGGFGIGDLRIVPKAQLLSTRDSYDDDGIALAILADLRLPTGNDEVLQGGDFRIGPTLAFDAMVNGVRFATNLGYLYRGQNNLHNLNVRDTMSWNFGTQVPVTDNIWATGEVFGRITPGADEIRRTESPTEFLLGGKFRHDHLFITAGGGAGLVNGYGTPDWRAFASLGWSTPRHEEEPIVVEEPEPDCRPETVDVDCGEAPETICEDNVLTTFSMTCQDGECTVVSSETPCAAGTECGIEDGQPACVPLPDCVDDADCDDVPPPRCEDDVLITYTGMCVDGECHYEPTETPCAEDEECGLRAGEPACVERTDLVEVDEETERIEIAEVVHFALDSAEIDERSYELLNQVARVLENNPHITRVRVEGHTDSIGAHAYNVSLSQRRAQSVVDFLIERGVDADRLHAVGHGPDRPIADNDTPQGRQENRRVEFHIEERD